MKVYLQGPDGEEQELDLLEPDPQDGTFVIPLDRSFIEGLYDKFDEGKLPISADFSSSFWIRIVPQD